MYFFDLYPSKYGKKGIISPSQTLSIYIITLYVNLVHTKSVLFYAQNRHRKMLFLLYKIGQFANILDGNRNGIAINNFTATLWRTR